MPLLLRYHPVSGAVMLVDGHAVVLDRQPHPQRHNLHLHSFRLSIGLHVALDLEGEHLELVQINFHTPSDFLVEGMQVLLSLNYRTYNHNRRNTLTVPSARG